MQFSLERCLAKRIDDDTGDSKPGQCVLLHSRIVGCVARSLYARLPSSIQEILPKEVVTLCAVHDLGKVSPGFQGKIWYEGELEAQFSHDLCYHNAETKHAVISEAAIRGRLRGAENPMNESWEVVVGGHHGIRDTVPDRTDSSKYGGKDWQSLREELIAQLICEFGSLPPMLPIPSQEQIDLATGLCIVADWIASDESLFQQTESNEADNLYKQAEDALNKLGWLIPKTSGEHGFESLFRIPNASPNEMQRAMFDAATRPGLFVLEAPMGLGKTEAALWAAVRLMHSGHHAGIYFALPTRTTSDKIHERIKPFLDVAIAGDATAKLLHGTAWMRAQDESYAIIPTQGPNDAKAFYSDEITRKEKSWFDQPKRGLLFPFGVGTIDQSLLGVLNVKHSVLRLFGLAGKIVILDEVHTYDMYTGTLLDKLVEKLINIKATVIILSATLTKERRDSFFSGAPTQSNAYPVLTYKYHVEPKVREVSIAPPPPKPLKLEHWCYDDLHRVAEHALERAVCGAQVLCAMNTVDRAQNLFRLFRGLRQEGKLAEQDIGILHSRFPVWKREEIENRWLEKLGKSGDRSRGSILVSTQVVEQSVDIDADVMISDLAPTDLIFQRIGRLWRHERKNRQAAACRLILLEPDWREGSEQSFADCLGSSKYVYAPYVLWRSYQVWHNRDSVTVPDDIRLMLEATYSAPDAEPAWASELRDEMESHKKKMYNVAVTSTSSLTPTQKDSEQKTRYNSGDAIDILLLKEKPQNVKGGGIKLALSSGEKICLRPGRRDRKTAVFLHRNIVSIRKRFGENATFSWRDNLFQDLKNCLDNYFFDLPLPLTFDANSFQLCTLDGENTPFVYDERFGLFREGQQKPATKPQESTEHDDDTGDFIEDFEW